MLGAVRETLATRLQAVENRIEAACKRAGRARSEVALIAVTKTVGCEVAALLPELGVLDLGESRPQELWRKAETLPKTVRWHFVGHLQRNKIEHTLPLVTLIHSVDSLRLLTALGAEAGRLGKTIEVLLEVNSGEAKKQGFAPGDLAEMVPELAAVPHVRIRGLMTMAAFECDAEHCRPTFIKLRELRDLLRGQMLPPHDLAHLSMGMTNDFEVAIEEGATMIRIGTALFEGLVSPASAKRG